MLDNIDWLALGQEFAFLLGELLLLFIVISFLVALLQVYVSQERIKRILTAPRRGWSSILGAMLGAVTPFCSCSTIPVLVGLLKSGAPFNGAMSFLLSSPVLNPAVVMLLIVFFGYQASVVYVLAAFTFAVVMGLMLDKLGLAAAVKNVRVSGGHQDGQVWEKLSGSELQRHLQAWRMALGESWQLFVRVLPYLLLGAGIGAFIHEAVPTELIQRFAGADSVWAVPLAALLGIPMYIRTETMIPIAGVLMSKGVAPGVMIALILGGAGCSLPEILLLSSVFKRRLLAAFIGCIFAMAVLTGWIFNFVL